MTDELKPCPFCNCEVTANQYTDIHPLTCYFVARQMLDDPQDIDRLNVAWDKRPGEDALGVRIAELEAALMIYAKEQNWHYGDSDDFDKDPKMSFLPDLPFMPDGGDIARRALERNK